MGNYESSHVESQTFEDREYHTFSPNDVVDAELIRRVDKTAYLLRNKFVRRYPGEWYACTYFSISKVYNTDNWIITRE